jgi:hypothetical protein
MADLPSLLGRDAEAEAPLREAITLYEQKGCVAFAERARSTLAATGI